MIELVSQDGRIRAVISELGASLSELWLGGIQIVGNPDEFSGVMMFPWPNRISDGTWEFEGRTFQLDINDLKQNAALHGLVFNKKFLISEQTANAVKLCFELEEFSGFPFRFALEVSFTVSTARVDVGYRITNLSKGNAPYSIGFHPYFLANESSTFSSAIETFSLGVDHVDKTLGPNLSSVQLKTENYSLELVARGTEYMHIFTNRYSDENLIWFAMEPQLGAANSLKTGTGIEVLNLDESRDYNFSLEFQ